MYAYRECNRLDRVPSRAKLLPEAIPWPTEPTPEAPPPEVSGPDEPDAEVRDVAKIPPDASPEPWTDFAAEGTIGPEEWDQRQESPAAARLRRRAAELRSRQSAESAEPHEYVSPVELCDRAAAGNLRCDRCGSDDLERFPARDGTWWRLDCMACGFGPPDDRTGHTVAFIMRADA